MAQVASSSRPTSAKNITSPGSTPQQTLQYTHASPPMPGEPQYQRPYVFLGGSCDPTSWRADIAVPKLTKFKIPFFNPQISDWHPNLIQLEAAAKEECQMLLFVIDSKTRAIASMLEATEYIMQLRSVVLVILDIPEGTKIDGEMVGARQLKDLNRARAFLCDIAARHQKHCDVFDSVENVTNKQKHENIQTIQTNSNQLDAHLLALHCVVQAISHIIYSHPSMSKLNNSTSPRTPI